MSLGSGVLPDWMILMPLEEWERKEITDEQLMAWLENPDNRVPEQVIKNWHNYFEKDKDEIQ